MLPYCSLAGYINFSNDTPFSPQVTHDFTRVDPTLIDITQGGGSEHLSSLVHSADLVVSLLPYNLHHHVAEACIQHGKNLVTASYCSPEMSSLHERAVSAGVTILNEV